MLPLVRSRSHGALAKRAPQRPRPESRPQPLLLGLRCRSAPAGVWTPARAGTGLGPPPRLGYVRPSPRLLSPSAAGHPRSRPHATVACDDPPEADGSLAQCCSLPSTALWTPRCHLRRSVRTRVSFSTRPASAPCARAPRLLASPHRLSEPEAILPCPRPPPPLPACSARLLACACAATPFRGGLPIYLLGATAPLLRHGAPTPSLGRNPCSQRQERRRLRLAPATGRLLRRHPYRPQCRRRPQSPRRLLQRPAPSTRASPVVRRDRPPRAPRRACISSSTAPPPARRPIRCSSATPRASSRALSRCCRGCANAPRPASGGLFAADAVRGGRAGHGAPHSSRRWRGFSRRGRRNVLGTEEEDGELESAPSPASEIAAMVFALNLRRGVDSSARQRLRRRGPTPPRRHGRRELLPIANVLLSYAVAVRSGRTLPPLDARGAAKRPRAPASVGGLLRSPHFSAGSDRRQRAGRSCCSSCARSSTRCSNSRRAAARWRMRGPPPTEAEGLSTSLRRILTTCGARPSKCSTSPSVPPPSPERSRRCSTPVPKGCSSRSHWARAVPQSPEAA